MVYGRTYEEIFNSLKVRKVYKVYKVESNF